MIKIYGTEYCSQCKITKNYCERNSIEFEYIDLDSVDNSNEIIGNFKSLPIVIINDDRWCGHNEDMLSKYKGTIKGE
jgi:glutaredoxin